MPVKANHARLVLTGKLLGAARKLAGLSQKEVASRVGCSQSNIAQIELAEYVEPDPMILQKLSVLYNLEYADVIACIVFERYQIDFSAMPSPPGSLRKIVVERVKSKVEADFA